MEVMTAESRQVNATYACKTKSCYLHPKVTCPREAWTPLHGEVRLLGDADYKGFLLRCYLVGVKVPNDSAFHLLPDVHWNRSQRCASKYDWRVLPQSTRTASP